MDWAILAGMLAVEIPAAVVPWVLVSLVGLAVHMVAEWRELAALRVLSKLVASTGFVLTAAAAGALELGWGRWLFAGLVLSWIGDVCLLGRSRKLFLLGLVAFLLGHVGYCVAFAVHGFASVTAMTVAPLLFGIALAVDRWLAPHVGDMRTPVRAYIVVISTMLTLALAAWRGGAPDLLVIGAVSFYVSDLAVARDRFVTCEFGNRLWGLPAYYLGQLCLALSVLALTP